MNNIKTYENPPITDVILEFRFDNLNSSDNVIDLLYKEIKNDFPLKEKKMDYGFQVKSFEKDFMQEDDKQQPITEFYNTEKTFLIHIAPNFLVFHQTKYVGGDKLKETIFDVLDKYEKVSEYFKIESLKLKYINRININKNKINLEDYFTVYPQIPAKLPPMKNFISQVEIPCEGNNLLTIMFFKIPPEESNTISLILDISYSNLPENIIKSYKEWLDTAHIYLLNIFNACITEETKKLFGGFE